MRLRSPTNCSRHYGVPGSECPQSCAHVVRLFVRERSRFTEEEVERVVAGGVDQYVDLGAGLNSFAWRRPTCVVSHQATLD